MHDFNQTLEELGTVLKNSTKSAEPLVLDLVKDAQIQSFLAAQRVFEAAMIALYESAEIEEDGEDCACDDVDHGMSLLLAVGVFSEDQHKKLSLQRDAATFISNARFWMGDDEDAIVFDECVQNINNYYYLLCACWRDLMFLIDVEDLEEMEELNDEH